MYKKVVLGVMCCLVARVCWGIVVDVDIVILRRGDANLDQVVDMSDASYINNWLYNGGPEPDCMNQADANNDGLVDGSDSTYILNWYFMGGPPPPTPGPFNTECAQDDEPYPGCELDPCQ